MSKGHEYCGDGAKSTSAPGSHEKSHEKLRRSRLKIHEGMPSELEAYHGTGKKDGKAGGM